jgi:hypothetical protein
MSDKVEKYIEKQELPQKEIVSKLRDIILKTLPEIKEDFKMGVPWYEEKFYLVALRDHVNLGFAVKGLTDSEMELFEGKGKLMRHLKFYTQKDIDEIKIVKLIKLVAERTVSCH